MEFVESSRLELKEVVNGEFKKEIVAFANTDGGEIYVGVASDGSIIGVDYAEQEMERISNMIHDGIHPDLIPFTSIETIWVEEKALIHIMVSRGGRPPYHLADKGLKPSGVYIRHGVTSVPASEEAIREMIRESDGITYDKARSINQELTFQYATQYFDSRKVGFQKENMRTLGLIDKDDYYTNVAFLLSDQCEHSIKCALFEGTGKMLFKSRKEFTGSLLKQLEESFEYLSLQNNMRAGFVGLERVESFDYPMYAIREALLNTIVHRDYDYSGSSIINIFSNRIEFVSIGGLVKGLTLPDIINGVSQSRNMVLANIFYRLKLMESYGTGIQRIMESYVGIKKPQFLVEASSFVTILPNQHQEKLEKQSLGEDSPEEKVLQMFSVHKEITRKEVEGVLGCSSFIARKILHSLLEQGVLVSIGNTRAVRYCLKYPQ